MRYSFVLLPVFAALACTDRQKTVSYQHSYAEIMDFRPKDTLFRISAGRYELGDQFAYANQCGDTIIPFGKFTHSFSDTLITFGVVIEKKGEKSDLIAINQQGKRLYEVHWFENGPDYVSEGVFRIQRNGKIGYADTTGRIVIPPQFACAQPFSEGKARVAYTCQLISDNEHAREESDTWSFIDKKIKREIQ